MISLAEQFDATPISPSALDAGTPNADTKEPAPLAAIPFRPAVTFLDLDEVLSKLGPIDYLVKGWIERNSIGVLFGPSGSYKSFLALSWGLHIAAHKDWNGFPVKGGPVFYIAGEGHNGLARRIKAAQIAYDLDMDAKSFHVSDAPVSIGEPHSARAVADAVYELSKRTGQTPALVIIDTLARNFGVGDENSTKDMGAFIHGADALIRARLKCVVLIVHHTGHEGKRERGNSALKSGVDFRYGIQRDGETKSVLVTNPKMKDSTERPEERFTAREVVIQEGVSTNGEPYSITSLALDRDHDWTPGSSIEERLKNQAKDEGASKLLAAMGRELTSAGEDLSQANLARRLADGDFGSKRTVERKLTAMLVEGKIPYGEQVISRTETPIVGGSKAVSYALHAQGASPCQNPP